MCGAPLLIASLLVVHSIHTFLSKQFNQSTKSFLFYVHANAEQQ